MTSISTNAQLVEEWKKQDPFLEDVQGFEQFLKQRIPKVLKEQEKKGKHRWDLFFSMWERPVVYDSMGRAWADTVPKWLHGQILIERLIQVMIGEEGIATDAEVVAHLYTAAMSRAIDRDWTEIYCFLTIKVMKHAGQKRDYDAVEKDLDIRPLTSYQQDMINRLKRQIWASGMRASEQKRRERKRSMKTKDFI